MKWLLYCNYLIMVPFLAGCSSSDKNDDNDTGTYRIYKEHLVDAYIEAEKMNVQRLNETTLGIYFSGARYSITGDASEVGKFKELAVKHNDDFRGYITVDFGYTLGNYVSYAENFSKIEISSNIPWDENHPAGSSLNDLCYFMVYSFAPTLKGDIASGGLTYIRKHADELTVANMELLEDGSLKLGFPDMQEYLSKSQIITISLTTETGRIFTADLKIVE